MAEPVLLAISSTGILATRIVAVDSYYPREGRRHSYLPDCSRLTQAQRYAVGDDPLPEERFARIPGFDL